MKQITLAVGLVFGRLTVTGNCMLGRTSAAICQCECGNIKTVRRWWLTNAKRPTRSCGCLAKEVARITLKCDRGSSFESPEAYAAHRKIWCSDYNKAYSARPEQQAIRRAQSKEIKARMTDEQREAERAKVRAYTRTPKSIETRKLQYKKYIETYPGARERRKQRSARHYEKNKMNPDWVEQNRIKTIEKNRRPETKARQKETTRILMLDPLYRAQRAAASEAGRLRAKETLSDTYIKGVLTQRMSFKRKDLPQDLIEVMREKIRITRFIEGLK
jgi:hypothetical protein